MERCVYPLICLLLFSLAFETSLATIPTALDHLDGSSDESPVVISSEPPQNLMIRRPKAQNGLFSEQSLDKSLDILIFPPVWPFPFTFSPPPSPPSPPPPSPPPPPPHPFPPPLPPSLLPPSEFTPPPSFPPPTPVSVATLSSIVISNGATLHPDFNELIFTYHASVSCKVSRVTVTANVTIDEENTEYELKVNGIGVISGIASPPFPLGKQGEGTEVVIHVYSVNHNPSDYTILVTRGKKQGGLSLGYLILIIVAVAVVALVLLSLLGYGLYQRRRSGRFPAWLNYFSKSEQPDGYTPIRPSNSP